MNDGSDRRRRLGSAAGTLALGIAVALAACGSDPLRQVRKATYPPDFQYITRGEIRTLMGSLAVEVDALDRVLGKDGGPLSEDREAIAAILGRMKPLAARLKEREQTNHPRLREHAPRLQEDIARALVGVRREPPNYYAAGRVSGACSYCHARRGTADVR